MKKFLGITIISAMILSMTACGNNESSENDNSSSAVNTSSVSTTEETDTETEINESTEDSSNIESEENSNTSWLAKQTFDTPSTSFEGTLFNEQVTLPLDLSTIDTYAAPYMFYAYAKTGVNVSSINDLINSDTIMQKATNELNNTNSEIAVQTSYTEEDGLEGPTPNDDEHCGLGDIYFYNFNENGEDLSIKECYENGWWYSTSDEYTDHIKTLQIDEGETDEETADNIIKKFGTPTYVLAVFDDSPDLDAYVKTMKYESIQYYNLIYEYDHFMLSIRMQEGFGEVNIVGVDYLPNEMWPYIQASYLKLGRIHSLK